MTQCHAPAQSVGPSTESLVIEGPNKVRISMTTADNLHPAHFNPITATIRVNNSGEQVCAEDVQTFEVKLRDR